MNLREFILKVAQEYDASAGQSTPLQQMFRHAQAHLGEHAPGGIEVRAGGGKGRATLTPWFGFFDPDVTTSPQEGIYVVYLFSQDLTNVTLSLMQGIEALHNAVGGRAAKKILAQDADEIHSRLKNVNDLDQELDLGSRGRRQREYEAGSIVSRRYEIQTLPSEVQFAQDLERFLALYQDAVQAKTQVQLTQPGTIKSPTKPTVEPADDPLRYFKPKSEEEYLSRIQGRVLVKSRRHERLVREYGEWALQRGFSASTSEHPRDLVLREEAGEWLIEAKVLYQGRAMLAVRDALGQLYDYRHFLYEGGSAPALVGLFSESIGDSYVNFLASCGILAVWREDGAWHGSKHARDQNLTD